MLDLFCFRLLLEKDTIAKMTDGKIASPPPQPSVTYVLKLPIAS